ncbi:hypothetical protein SRHO_G00191550 [Serrasalmus rhombeus]
MVGVWDGLYHVAQQGVYPACPRNGGQSVPGLGSAVPKLH